VSKIWVVADWHLGQDNMLTWVNEDGTKCRPFDSLDVYHETIIRLHNELVMPEDKVYVLGDAVIKKPVLQLVREFNGKKTLVSGNHDIFSTKEYLAAGFKNVRGIKVLTEHAATLSHIPLHPDSLNNRKCGQMINIHGHTHGYRVQKEVGGVLRYIDDNRYKCVSMEQTEYKPRLIEEVL
jgi:calcineurin-like phosphoesterase family protein